MSRPAVLVAVLSVAVAACGFTDPAPPTTTSAPTAPVSSSGASEPPGACWSAVPTGSGPVGLMETDLGLGALLTGVMGHAVAVGDPNGDGWPDLFVGSFADRSIDDYRHRGADGPAPDRILWGGTGGFTEGPSFGWGRTSGALFADLDGDGDEDLVAVRNHRDSERAEVTLDPTRVFRNDGETWTPIDLGELGGRAAVAIPTDGSPHLLITEDHWSGGRSLLLHNEGGLGFAPDRLDDLAGFGAVAADLDGDGHVDLFVAGPNRLLAGTGSGFDAIDIGFAWEGSSVEDDVTGITLADIDRDGRLDVVLGHHFNSILEGAPPQPIRLFLNRSTPGDFAFEEITGTAGLEPLPTKSPHVTAVDVDQDGWVDLVTSASSTDDAPVWFRSLGTDPPTFEQVGEAGPAQYWVTGAAGDFDRDGTLEVFLAEWDPALPSRIWTVDGAVGGWVEVSAPLGSRVEARVDDEYLGVAIAGGSTGYAAGAAASARFGIGDATSAHLTITTPDGTVTTLEIPANTRC